MIGFIGGSGLYALDALTDVTLREVETPFGRPSDAYVCGRLAGRPVCFLPRHGRGHRLLPSEINHRANIFGFKLLGVDMIVSAGAVGSLREELRPRDIVLPDQYIDRTKQWANQTFFGAGVVAHVSMAEPCCAPLRALLAGVSGATAARLQRDIRIQPAGTYLNMEGPAFSTRAESNMYRGFGCDVIGMTSLPEAKLCKEAEICYQSLAMVTDYDCWHATEEAVNVNMVIEHLAANTHLAQEILKALVPLLPEPNPWPCRHALAAAILTAREGMDPETVTRLAPLLAPHLGG